MMDEAARERFISANIMPEGYVVPAYTGVEIALQALERTKTDETTLADNLNGGSFDTIIGAVTFDDKGDLAQNPFILQRYDGERFLPVM